MVLSCWTYHDPVDSDSMILAIFPVGIISGTKNIYVQKKIYYALVVIHWKTLK